MYRQQFHAAAPAVLLTLALAGCAEAPTANILDASALGPSATVHGGPGARPIMGRCETTFNPPPVPPPPVHRQTDTGLCQISHLGRTEVVSVQDINFAAGTQAGERTLTAANGDKLYATHAGTSAPTAPGRIGFSATLTFTGGTGRFENARGQASARGEANLATRTTTLTMIGWIAYDASDRSGS